MSKRRGTGEGTVFARPKNGRRVWVAELTTSAGGRRQRQTRYARTQREALEKLEQMRAQRAQGVDFDAARETVGSFLETWLVEMKGPDLRPSTRRDYRWLLDKLILPDEYGLGRRRLDRLQPIHVERWHAALRKRGVGSRARQQAHAVLRAALGRAVRLRAIALNPAAREAVDAPKHRIARRSVLDTPERPALLAAAEGHPLEGMFVLAATCGLRYGEAAALLWGDVDWKEGTLQVRRTLVEDRGTGARSVGAPKTESSTRTLPLPARALAALRRHRARIAGTPHPARPLFLDANGAWLRRSNFLRRAWRPLLATAGLAGRGLRFHDLRHSYATAALGSGVDLGTLSELLGHATPAITASIYCHSTDAAKRAAIGRVDELLGS